jgi:hypothetical protein
LFDGNLVSGLPSFSPTALARFRAWNILLVHGSISVNFPQGAKTLPTEEIISQCSYIEKIITIFASAHISLE